MRWLIGASLFFYAFSSARYLPLLMGSILANYLLGDVLRRNDLSQKKRRRLLILGLFFNLFLLAQYKYTDFIIYNLNTLFGAELNFLGLALPLAISFYTFQQIAYLVDSYYRKREATGFEEYILFVTFFPQLIAGPIVHHSEMVPQFKKLSTKGFRLRNVSTGLFILLIGLFKKTVLADYFGGWARLGFDLEPTLNFFEAWITSLSYTWQLYFDFSGYTDMAIGAAFMFGIKLPINFDSPYQAINIQDFWRRWHITLSRFARDYIYIPLGGNRRGFGRTNMNTLAVFLLVGLWHGAGWLFIVWGLMHGLALVASRYWQRSGIVLPKILAWLITFNFVNLAWVFFRARSLDDALKVAGGMVDIASFREGIGSYSWWLGTQPITWIIAGAFVIVLGFNNSNQILKSFRPNGWYWFLSGILFYWSAYNLTEVSEFLYFNF